MDSIGVIGSGTMGRGIAQAAALAGYEVILYDIEESILAAARAAICGSIDKGVARGKTEDGSGGGGAG